MKQFEITELIPQRSPFIMVDSLQLCDEQKTVSVFTIRPGNVLNEQNAFSEAGLIENIAQTAAARMGYQTRAEGKEPLIGYIGAVKNLTIHFIPEIFSELKTEIEVTSEIMGFTVIVGKVFAKGMIAAECEMRIFLLGQSGTGEF